LSLERAREFDRVSEWLATNKKRSDSQSARELESTLDNIDRTDSSGVGYGIEGRRAQFDKTSYRQPVLTQKPLKPKNYRRGQPDLEAEQVRRRLQELQDYELMDEGLDVGADTRI
jgi:hypothetical protein